MTSNKFYPILLLTYLLVSIAGCGGGGGGSGVVITPTPPVSEEFTCEFNLPSGAVSILKAAHDQHSNNNVELEVLIDHAKQCVEAE